MYLFHGRLVPPPTLIAHPKNISSKEYTAWIWYVSLWKILGTPSPFQFKNFTNFVKLGRDISVNLKPESVFRKSEFGFQKSSLFFGNWPNLFFENRSLVFSLLVEYRNQLFFENRSLFYHEISSFQLWPQTVHCLAPTTGSPIVVCVTSKFSS